MITFLPTKVAETNTIPSSNANFIPRDGNYQSRAVSYHSQSEFCVWSSDTRTNSQYESSWVVLSEFQGENPRYTRDREARSVSGVWNPTLQCSDTSSSSTNPFLSLLQRRFRLALDRVWCPPLGSASAVESHVGSALGFLQLEPYYGIILTQNWLKQCS